MTELFKLEDLVSSYSRAQALADGLLIDVTTVAKEAGFSVAVALTHAVWVDCVEWTEGDAKRKATHQDEAGRLWDVVWMAFCAARRAAGKGRCTFEILRVPRSGRGIKPRSVYLSMQIGSGDTGEPVITIMQPTED
jgi:hypothetical protein